MSRQLPDSTIHPECYMTNPPSPTAFVVVQNKSVVAVLSLNQVETAVDEYRRLKAARIRNLNPAKDSVSPTAAIADRQL
jgi:hypothetical protein